MYLREAKLELPAEMCKNFSTVFPQTHLVLSLYATKPHHHPTSQEKGKKEERMPQRNQKTWWFSNVLYGLMFSYRSGMAAK